MNSIIYSSQAKRFTSVFGLAVLGVILAGCATTLPFQVQRLPAWNTLGIRRIAVMPFTMADDSSLQRQAAAWLTNESLSRIQATNHFTLVNSSEVSRVQRANGDIGALTDALFGGQVLSVSVQDTSTQHQMRNRDDTVTNYTLYHREVRMSFSYNLSRTGRDADMIGTNTRTNLSRTDSNLNQGNLKSAETLVQEIIQSDMAGIASYLAPHTVTERRTLEKESSKDKVVKQRAKDAEAQVKAGNYRVALDAFLGIFRDTGSFAAAYNAGILMEVMGELDVAVSFMQQVHSFTGNPRASNEVTRLLSAIANIGLLDAFAVNQTQRDRLITLMVDILPGSMPNNPRVALINNSRNERDLAETVLMGIMDGFLSKNITVVDRESRALVEMERDYQLSGYVSDDQIMSIGNAVGVNTFVLVSVTGSGASRRLSVRMVDVARNTVIYQSPQTDEMNL